MNSRIGSIASNQDTLAPAASTAPRFDLYADIHKALRACLSDTLARVGRADAGDAGEVAAALAATRALLAMCASHVAKEETYLHPAIEAARAGTTAPVADDHAHHLDAIAALEADVATVASSTDDARDAALTALYRALSLFVADNLAHMHVEETVHNAALWAAYTDDALHAIEHAILASIGPDEMADVLRWMIPSITAASRARMFAGMRAGLPSEAFAGVLDLARSLVDARDFAKLEGSLGLDSPAPLARAA